MTALYIIIAIAAVIALIIFIPIDAAFSVSYVEKNADVRLTVKYFPIKLHILPAKVKKEAERAAEDTENVAKKEEDEIKKKKRPVSATIQLARAVIDETWEDIKRLIHDVFAHMLAVNKFFVNVKIGTGDPMYTGIAYGAANTFIYGLLALIENHSKLGEWDVDISADFDGFVIEGSADIVIRTRIASILAIGFKAAIILLKILRINRRLKKNG